MNDRQLMKDDRLEILSDMVRKGQPIDFSEATGKNSVTGKFLSSSTFIITPPTSPVAPQTAIFIFIKGFNLNII